MRSKIYIFFYIYFFIGVQFATFAGSEEKNETNIFSDSNSIDLEEIIASDSNSNSLDFEEIIASDSNSFDFEEIENSKKEQAITFGVGLETSKRSTLNLSCRLGIRESIFFSNDEKFFALNLGLISSEKWFQRRKE